MEKHITIKESDFNILYNKARMFDNNTTTVVFVISNNLEEVKKTIYVKEGAELDFNIDHFI